MNHIIRTIEQEDDKSLARIIKSTLESQGNDIDGTVYTDEATNHMSLGYKTERSVYYIVEDDGVLLGGSGIAQIPGESHHFCELQRMFLAPEARGKGIGAHLMKKCLDFARTANYSHCYLETFENMKPARKLYELSGFKYIDYRMGETGHFSCNVWMLLEL